MYGTTKFRAIALERNFTTLLINTLGDHVFKRPLLVYKWYELNANEKFNCIRLYIQLCNRDTVQTYGQKF
ncbi:hypothetical protein V1478_014794 [Vespula squamosa]|uniref:Uncharacterized protein n=1 Tax=Vespula squamosa TaxID=30214 RepID=A0ABD2A394_VESSQ